MPGSKSATPTAVAGLKTRPRTKDRDERSMPQVLRARVSVVGVTLGARSPSDASGVANDIVHLSQRGSTSPRSYFRFASPKADNRFLTTSTNPHKKMPFDAVFYRAAIVGRLMHILPAGLWSAIAPLQLSPTFRLRHCTAHRRLGRLFIAMSVSISIGVVPIITSGATILYQVGRWNRGLKGWSRT